MNLKFTNNASAKLAEAISSTSTTLKVESDKGSLFPSITSPEYFYVTLVGDSVMEIVKVTARNSDTFTIVRAQDGTTAQAFSTGDVVELRITAAAFNDISTAIDELDAFPEQTGNSGKYLQTDGTNVKWSTVDTYPSQSGKSGQSLVTDGASTLWHPIAQDILDAAELASSGNEGEASIHEPLLGTVQHEMGSWWISLDNSIPTGGLPHLGHICSRATYGDFWVWCEGNKTVVSEEDWTAYADAHNGCCPWYSYGDGSTTFRTPKYDQSFLKVLASIGNTGKMEEAGLPNITGTFFTGGFAGGNSGAFGLYGHGGNGLAVDHNGAFMTEKRHDFYASNSNSIYGNSDTVTPQNFGIIVGVYAVGAVSAPIGETDAANLLNGISTLETGKASVDLSNLSTAGRSLAAGLGMPSGRYVNLTLGASGSSFTAPADGFFCLAKTIGTSGAYLSLFNTDAFFGVTAIATSTTNIVRIFIPAKKGQTINVGYNATGATQYFRFIYAEGAE